MSVFGDSVWQGGSSNKQGKLIMEQLLVESLWSNQIISQEPI